MIIKYKKVLKQFDDRISTTYTLVQPDYKDTDPRCTELCTIGEDTYVNVPDGVNLPEQPKQIAMEVVTLTDELRAEIKAVSPHVKLINARVVEKIRGKYSVNDEFKMLRIEANGEQVKSKKYFDHVDACIAWGAAEKGRIGL